MNKLIYLIFIIILQNSFGQTSNCDLQSENEKWILRFEDAKSNNDKINLIKEKIKADSIYIETMPKIPEQDQPSAKSENRNVNGEFCGCRIRFYFNVGKDKYVEANLNAKPKLSSAVNKLNIQHIKKIEYINKKVALHVFGPWAKAGIIYIYLKSKTLRREINSASI